MDKNQVDEIIKNHLKKIYGFSLSRTRDIDVAEELASDIIFEVYKALLKAENIRNIDGYVFRIANNVYSRFVKDRESYKITYNLWDQNVKQREDETDDAFTRLRSEIAYLSKIQREITVLHYFQKKNLREISDILSLPYGTIRWHLFEARNQLKQSLIEHKVYKKDTDLISFSKMHQLGKLILFLI